MIDSKYNCVFIHIPKSAGTFVEHTLMDGREKYKVDLKDVDSKKSYIETIDKKDGHIGMPYYVDSKCITDIKHWTNWSYGETINYYENYFKFTFVRNPWVRLYSLYNYIKNNEWDENLYVKNNNFNQCISLLKKHNGTSKMWNLLGYAPDNNPSQINFLNPIEKLDFIGKTENFESDFKYVMKQIGINSSKVNFEEKINNVKKTKSIWEVYSKKSKEIVKTLCKKDVDLWEYKFGD